jgi:hypothetical protein
MDSERLASAQGREGVRIAVFAAPASCIAVVCFTMNSAPFADLEQVYLQHNFPCGMAEDAPVALYSCMRRHISSKAH